MSFHISHVPHMDFFIAIHVHSPRPSAVIEAMVDADLLASWHILKFGLLVAHGFLTDFLRLTRDGS